MFNKLFRKSCRLGDNVDKYGTVRQATDDNIIRRMRFACWITKAKNTHSEYVILIAFPWEQWLSERASVLCLYLHCLSCNGLLFISTQNLLFICLCWLFYFESMLHITCNTDKVETFCTFWLKKQYFVVIRWYIHYIYHIPHP
jgi:hypothetical protein